MQTTNDYSTPLFGFVDGHADTITEAIGKGQGLFRNNLHLDFERLSRFKPPVQVFAIWCADRYLDNAFEYANSAIDFFYEELEKHRDIIEIALSLEDMERNARNNKISAVLALEGGEPLVDRIEYIDHFFCRGVRLVTLTWSRETELGYGVASGSEKGLKPFGVECVRRMNELGIIIDVSHLNEAGFCDVAGFSTKPFVASHSNAYSVSPHERNLKDGQIKAITGKGGMIGINLCPGLLTNDSIAHVDIVMDHIRHFIETGAVDNLGLGCDLDGIPAPPEGFTDVLSLNMLADKISGEFGEDVSQKIMSGNYYDFFVRFFASES